MLLKPSKAVQIKAGSVLGTVMVGVLQLEEGRIHDNIP